MKQATEQKTDGAVSLETVQKLLMCKKIKKDLFESNSTYRTYWLSEVMPDGTERIFKYINKHGKSTHMWNEKFINGEWQQTDNMPPDAFVGGAIAVIKNGKTSFHNTCDYFGLS